MPPLLSSHRNTMTEIDDASSPYGFLDGSPDYLICDTTVDVIIATLPTLADNQGRVITVKNIGTSANDVTLAGEGADTIEGEPTQTIADGYSYRIVGTATEWKRLVPYVKYPVMATFSEDDVSDPPGDTELDTAFGEPTALGAGFIGILDDGGAGTDVYICFTTGVDNQWFYVKGTLAQDPM